MPETPHQLRPAGAVLSVHATPPLTLDGVWEFFPGVGKPGDATPGGSEPIEVPGLWEAQGYRDLDGVASYRRAIDIDDQGGCWTLRFGAVMDHAAVWWNGAFLGEHTTPFTPFEADVTGLVAAGANELGVAVTDYALADSEHVRSPHGKQGWSNHEFPSPPSLYMTYGGIWQSVTLRRHGPVALRDLWFNGDPDDLVGTVEVENVSDAPAAVEVRVTAVGRARASVVAVPARGTATVPLTFAAVDAPRWSPEEPALHTARCEVRVEGEVSDAGEVRFGLRTFRVEGDRFLLNGEPYRMRSTLVQGFYADTLYAEPSREAIEAEVQAARDMGFNTLRLHIKAFDPRYLDVCDELGMLAHCDLPVAEPIAHGELGADGAVAVRCRDAVTAQVRRDRNHPSIILWSAMNELGLEGPGARQTEGYERFARLLAGTIAEYDPTRPFIENDWVDPDPGRVFTSPVLTAHWYGRLDARYLDTLDGKVAEWRDCDRPFLVSEFGDWGLPLMDGRTDKPFWWYGDHYAEELRAMPWPGTLDDFCRSSQRYMGLADRLQIEIFRRHAHCDGFCLTELTDVPWELNGLLDLERNPKDAAITEVRRANQQVLPMLVLPRLSVLAGEELLPSVWVANDGAELIDVQIEVVLGESRSALHVEHLPAYLPRNAGTARVVAPETAGEHQLTVRLMRGDRLVAVNSYPLLVSVPRSAGVTARCIGGAGTRSALTSVGAELTDDGVLVVGEDALDADAAHTVRARLEAGGSVLILAQGPEQAGNYPLPVEITSLTTEWGGTDFHFTTDEPVLTAFPRCAVLDVHDMTIRPTTLITGWGGGRWAEQTVVGLHKPMPRPNQGLIVGAQHCGAGRIVVCQYRLERAVPAGDAAALGVLADLVAYAAGARPPAGARER